MICAICDVELVSVSKQMICAISVAEVFSRAYMCLEDNLCHLCRVELDM